MSTLTDKTGAAVTVSENADKSRYEVSTEGTMAGFTAYADRGDQRIFYHTEVSPEFGGRGLGTILIEQALTDVRAQGKRVVGVCPMVAAYLTKHHDFDDITDPVTPEILAYLKA
ncbi:N-acetyltransferase [Gordonia jinhuaensis]|uniref:N-acetyltransferase n=1 Tax=Gordonia jinhuaensis TaxID=1517702 RepID=A0A916TDQ8_9ACTN|nr:GNAT family N-acetyltransferase [Gordonia jinhuaensis]GGB41003.1 N-acetyltransferase [Gordonia jinhuaensis]